MYRPLSTKLPLLIALCCLRLLAVVGAPVAAVAESITVLTEGDMAAWNYQVFDNIAPTRYQTNHDEELGAAVLFSDSQNSASGYMLKQFFDLRKTPWVHFQWRVDESAQKLNEWQKAEDDCAFRLSFIHRELMGIKTLMLVRATAGKSGETWESPYSNPTFDLRLYAFADGDDELQTWHSESINLAKLWQQLFDEEVKPISAIALMTDSDSAGVVMKSRFGAIVLSDSAVSPFAAR